MKKIAVPTHGKFVDNHFGHCEVYTLFTVNENNETIHTEILPSPQGCGCKSNIASTLRDQGVTLMLAGNMGEGARNVLTAHQIEVIRGCSGKVERVVKDYLQGTLEDSGHGCEQHHHEEGHQCNH